MREVRVGPVPGEGPRPRAAAERERAALGAAAGARRRARLLGAADLEHGREVGALRAAPDALLRRVARRGLGVAAGEDVGADLPSVTRSDVFTSSGGIRAKTHSRRSTPARTS